jgi:proteasome beta subunit
VDRASNQRGVLTTGTTTVGIVTKEGVVLATDRRVTAGYYIAHRKGKKIWKIDNHVAATMSGAVADVQMILNELTHLAMDYKINHQTPIPIRTLANYASVIMFYSRPMIYIAHMIIGGVDGEEGPVLYAVDWYGSFTREDRFMSTGSGSPTAFGVLEDGYRDDITLNDAVKLAIRAVKAAMLHDPGSGEGVDVITITKESGYSEVQV